MLEAARFLVHGRVQGVGFRSFVVGQAESHGVRGWVRNLAGGGVEVLACGAPEALEGLAASLARGPRHARVLRVERVTAPPYREEGFVVRW